MTTEIRDTIKAALTAHQKHVLRLMDERNLGAVLFEGRYQFPVNFRNDSDLAERFDRRISLGE